MEPLEDKIGNGNQPLFDGTDTDRLNCSTFGDTGNSYNNLLSYGEQIQYQKEVEVNEACIEALEKYILSKVVVPGKYYIPVLYRVKLSKHNALGKPIGE